jgi:hypothetical protein
MWYYLKKNKLIQLYNISEMIQKTLILLLTALCLAGCTRDDLCSEDTLTTPLLVIKFMDLSNPTQVKAVTNLRVTLADTEQTEIIAARTDTLYKIPLNPTATGLNFNFTEEFGGTEPNTDAINIRYQRGDDIYINRACAFRTTFIDVNLTIQPEGSANWMLATIINNAIVENEDVTHITIFH